MINGIQDKSTFEFFLPVWINKAHAADQQTWQHELIRQVKMIAAKAFEVSDEEEALPVLLMSQLFCGVVDPIGLYAWDQNAMNMYYIYMKYVQ